MATAAPVKVAIGRDADIVVMGLREMLRPFQDRVVVTQLGDGPAVPDGVDVVLVDDSDAPADPRLGELLRGSKARVVLFTWNTEAARAGRIARHGVSAWLSKKLTAVEIVEAIESIHTGGPRTAPRAPELPGAPQPVGSQPGWGQGLSPRESEVLDGICRGMGNTEIATRCFIGVNTVKTYVRTTYRKIGATSRAQAVLWGVRHGFPYDGAACDTGFQPLGRERQISVADHT